MSGSRPITAALETLGCKVNQYESAFFLEILNDAGFRIVPFSERADLYLVHSCAVTSKAAFQTRQLLRRAQRLNPGALVIAAGCDAQLEADRFERERLATHILGTLEKVDLLDFLERTGSFSKPFKAVSNPRHCDVFRALPIKALLTGRARAFFKIQDGCDAFCSYCVVPITRGKSRSLPAHEVRNQMNRFLECGFNEVVLTGIHLGQWGADFQPAEELSDLLSFMDGAPLPTRIRLSSLEPMEMTCGLLNAFLAHPWICPHFHIPLQSGDAEILKKMGRPYSPAQYAEIISELHRVFPDAAIGADVMVGFPGETPQHFRNTRALIEQLPFSYLHVFPFSPRPGTRAAALPGRVEGSELRLRVQDLRDLGTWKKRAFQSRFMGRCLQVLVERHLGGDWWQGTSDNYLRVRLVSKNMLSPGLLADVRCTHMELEDLTGEVISILPYP